MSGDGYEYEMYDSYHVSMSEDECMLNPQVMDPSLCRRFAYLGMFGMTQYQVEREESDYAIGKAW